MHRCHGHPSIGRFVSQDPGSGSAFEPQSQNPYIYGINNPLTYEDLNGAAPTNCPTYSIVCLSTSIAKAAISIPLFFSLVNHLSDGDITIGSRTLLINPTKHEIWAGYRVDGEDVGWTTSKLDRPKPPRQPSYHLVIGDEKSPWQIHRGMPDSLGKGLDAFFSHADAAMGILGVVGLGLTAWDVYTAYQQGTFEGNRELVRQAFSWGGAIAGGEAGALIGTAIFPGVGTVIGGFVGGVLGGFGGDWLANQFFNTPLPGFIYYSTPVYGKGHVLPM